MKFLNHNLFTGDITVNGTTTLSTATGVTRPTGDNTTHLATTAFVKAQDYATNTALGNYVPISRTLTINGITYDLSANRSWTISSADGYISNVQVVGSTLFFTGVGSAFSGVVDLSTLTPTVRTVFETVKNVSGATILKGTPLAVVAGQTSGNVSDVVPADAADPTKMPAVFIANQNIADEAEGEAVLFGNLTGVDTSLYQSGTTVYVAPGGGWTATKPVWPNLIQNLGVITKQHATNGAGIVTGVGRANALPNLTAGKIWVGSANYPIESTTVHVDEANARVGIGTTNPSAKVDIEGSVETRYLEVNAIAGFAGIGSTSSAMVEFLNAGDGNTLFIKTNNSVRTDAAPLAVWTQTNPRFIVRNDGNVGIGTANPIYKLQVSGSAYVNGGTLFIDSGQYLRWGDSNQGIVGENNTGVSIVAGGSTRQTVYADGRTYFPGLDLSISNVNSTHGTGTYFRGSSTHFVLGLNDGNTLYLNYGNPGGTIYSYGTNYHSGTTVINGTASYTTGGAATLSVVGNVISFGASNGDLSYFRRLGAGQFQWQTYNSGNTGEIHLQPYGGNVGIGTTSPSEKLDVYGAIKLSGQVANVVTNGIAHHTNGYVYFTGGTAGAAMGNDSYSSAIYAVDDGSLELYAGSSNRLHITSAGNVGIGTTSPAHKLTVTGGNLAVENGNIYLASTYPIYFDYGTSNSYYVQKTGTNLKFGTGGTFYFDGGNVGIGTTAPAAKLHVYQSNSEGIYLDGLQEYTTFKMLYGGNQKAEVVYQYSTDQMYFNKFGTGTFAFYGGSVGIGTGSPSEKLHVDGRVRIATIDNGAGDFATISGTGVITRRTAAQVLSDIGAQPSGSYLTAETDTLATVTARGSSTNGSIFINGIFTGGFGAVTTSGTLDWNDVSNARAGQGYTLLLGTATNGMGGGQYYHPVSFEYSSKNGSGNMTQLAIPYTGNGIWYRNRYDGSWSSWARVWDDSSFTSTNITNWNTAYGWGNHASQGYATQTYVNTAIANLVDSAPSTLDTLNELAAALGDDPNFATTVTNSIASKVSKSGDTMTGNLTTTGLTVGNGVATGRQPYGPLANANIVLTSSASDSSGVCGIEFTSGNNYPSDGATIYFENNAGGTSERAKLTLRVDNDQEDFIELRAGKVVINANTYSGGGQNPAVVFQHNDTQIASITSGGQIDASGGNSSQWNAAYGWGNHSGLYLPLGGGTLTGDLNLNYGYPRINFYDSGNNPDYSLINNDGDFSLYDITNNVHRLWVSSAGNVGIGTTSPSSKLQVVSSTSSLTDYGMVTFQSSDAKGISFGFDGGNDWAWIYSRYVGFAGKPIYINNNLFVGAFSSNVGIGTTSPAYKLDVSGNSRTTGIHYVDTYLVTPLIYGGGPITMGNEVIISNTEDGKLTLRVPSGDTSDWNYINFTGANGVRDAYFGTDSGGTPTWWRDDNGVNITLGSSVLINGNTAWHAGNDGSGSGLDADLLDGQHGSYYAAASALSSYLPLAGGTMTGTIYFSNDMGTALQGTIGDNDFWRIRGGNAGSNAGFLEIATSDDGTEPIYVRQYTGVFSSLTRTATLLDGSGNTSLPGSLTVGGTITENSSIRYKENIVDLESATEKVEQLRAVRYNKIGHEVEEIGLIAEEVAEVYPEVVNYNEEGQPDGVNYTRLSVILLKALQEQNAVIASLSERINKLESK